jgi:hypothetical protein
MQDQHHRPTTDEKNALDAPRSRIGPESWLGSHGDCLYRYALLRVRAPELAAELVQETFLEAISVPPPEHGSADRRKALAGCGMDFPVRQAEGNQPRPDGRKTPRPIVGDYDGSWVERTTPSFFRRLRRVLG